MADALDLAIARPINFDPSVLGDPFAAYAEGQKLRKQRELDNALAGGLPKDAAGNIDWPAAVNKIASLGNIEALAKVAPLAAQQQQLQLGMEGAKQAARLFDGGQAASTSQPSSGEPRGIRNNNPLNLEASAFTQKMPGYQGSDGRFGRFDTPENGIAAADQLLQNYGRMGVNTLSGVIQRWAPAADGNPVGNYVASVAAKAGIDPSAPINLLDPDVRKRILAGMAQFENGKPVQVAQAGATTVPGGLSGGADDATQRQIDNITRVLANPFIPASTKEALKVRLEGLQKSAEPTSDRKNYEYYVRQTRAAGKEPDTFEDYSEKQSKAKAGQTIVNNVTNPVFKGMAERFDKAAEQANAAAQDIRTIHDARAELEKGIKTGSFADKRLALSKVGQLFGIPDEQIANTETFQLTVGQRVFALVKNLGAGTGISNADKEFSEKMAAGNITLDEQSIRRVFDIAEKANRARIQQHNKLVGKYIGAQSELAPYKDVLMVEEPGPYAPRQATTQQQGSQPDVGALEAEMRRRGLLK